MIEKRQTSLFSGVWREIRKKIHQKFTEKCKIRQRYRKKSEIQLFNREKNLAVSDEKIEIRERSKTVQRSALRRSRRELSNEYLLAKIGVDTAENEPLEVWGKIQFTIHFAP